MNTLVAHSTHSSHFAISREAILHVVKELPAAPVILAKLGDVLVDPNADMDDIIRLLRCDMALTARVIRISNSPVYNTGRPHASVEEAMACVGFNEVYRLTGLAAVSQLADQALTPYGIAGVELRENALLTALVCEELAAAAGVEPREAYTAGLMRSVGKIAFARLLQGRSLAHTFEARDRDGLAAWEHSLTGTESCAAAAIILREWRFPGTMIVAVEHHYLRLPRGEKLINLLNVASHAADRCGHGLAGESRYWELRPEKLEAVGIDQDALDHATRRALELFGPLRAAVA